MRTVCKFRCDTASPEDGEGPHTASFSPVYCGSPENEQFFRYTPSGSISLAVVRQQLFVPGKEYYVTFEEAPKAAP